MESSTEDAMNFTKMWMDFASKMTSAAAGFSPETPPPDAARLAQRMYLQAMGQYADEYLRSPQFLEMMKKSMDAAVAMRKQWNDFNTQARHAVQGVAQADVDGMLNAMRRVESRVLEKLDDIAEGFEAIEKRLSNLEAAGSKRNREDSAKSAI